MLYACVSARTFAYLPKDQHSLRSGRSLSHFDAKLDSTHVPVASAWAMDYAAAMPELDSDEDVFLELDYNAEAEHDMRVFEMSIQRSAGEFLIAHRYLFSFNLISAKFSFGF